MIPRHLRTRHLSYLFALTVLVFINSLGNGFHLDDHYRLLGNPGVEVFWPPWRHFFDASTSATLPRIEVYRPVATLSYSLNYLCFGHSVVAYRVVNLLLHFGSVVTLYLLVVRILRSEAGRLELGRLAPGRLAPGRLALAVAALYAVHPVASVPVNYLCIRDLLLMQLLLLQSLLAWSSWRSGGRWRHWVWFLAAGVLSMLSKQNGLQIFWLIGLFDALVLGRSMRSRQDWSGALSMLAAAVVVLTFARLGAGFDETDNIVVRAPEAGPYVLGQLQHHLFFYLRNMAWPFGIAMETAPPWEVWRILVGGVVLVVAVGLALRCWRPRPLLAFCILAYLGLMALTSSFLALIAEVVPYRSYPSNAFLLLGVVLLLRRRLWLVLPLLAYFSVGSMLLNRTWRSDEALWRHSVELGGSTLARMNLAMSLPDDGEQGGEKRRLFEELLVDEPGFIMARINFGLYEIRAGRSERGLALVREALSLDRGRAQSWYWLAQACSQTEQLPAAVRAASQAHQLQPEQPLYRYYLGACASRAGMHRLAVRHLDELRRSRPHFYDTSHLAGRSHHALGDLATAIRCYQEFTAAHPEIAAVWFDLGRAWRDQQRLDLAVAQFRRCLEQDPDYPLARRWLRTCEDELRRR